MAAPNPVMELPRLDGSARSASGKSSLSCIELKLESLHDGQQRTEQILGRIQADLGKLVIAVARNEGVRTSGPMRSSIARRPSRHVSVFYGDGQDPPISRPSYRENTVFAQQATFAQLSVEGASQVQMDTLDSCGLPPTWPASVAVRKSMMDRDQKNSTVRQGRTLMAKRNGTRSFSEAATTSATSERNCCWTRWRRFMMDPRSSRHLVYNSINLVFLLYDLTMIPYLLAFDIPLTDHVVLYLTTTLSCIFWTLDIGVTFCTGVFDGHHLEMRPQEVAKRFARTTLVPDLLMASCNWLSLALATWSTDSQGMSSIRIVRFAQAGKLLRVTGMLRTMRLFRVFEDVLDHLMPDIYQVALKCMSVVIGVAWINHLLGCAWYALGRAGYSDTGLRWTEMRVQSQEDSGFSVDFLQTGPVYQYITAFHWSVAQFTLGATDANPVNSMERSFNTACLLMGLIFGSTLISSLSASMVDFQMSRKSRNDELRKLRIFLRESHVSPTLSMMVHQQATDRLRRQELVAMKDVQALSRISNALLTDLKTELFTPYLNKHELFRMWATYDRTVLTTIVKTAIEVETLLQKDDLFSAGMSTDRAYCLMSGVLEYVKEPGCSPVACLTSCKVDTGSWIAEACLWTHWTHVGTAWAVSGCQILEFNAEGIQHAMRSAPDLREVNNEYCVQFHKRIVSARPPLPWPDDLYIPDTEFPSLVLGMSLETQVAISEWALDEALAASHGWLDWKTRRSMKSDIVRKMKEEINAGESCVTLGNDGVIRAAVLIVLDVTSRDGSVLVNLGNADNDGDMTCIGKSPAKKKNRHETVAESIGQLLKSLGLEKFSDDVQRLECDVFHGHSKRFGIPTRFQRLMHSLNVSDASLKIQSITATVPLPVGRHNSGDPRPKRTTLLHGRATQIFGQLDWKQDFKYITVYKVKSSSRTKYYTWLSPADAERLSAPGEKELKDWLAAVRAADEDDIVGI